MKGLAPAICIFLGATALGWVMEQDAKYAREQEEIRTRKIAIEEACRALVEAGLVTTCSVKGDANARSDARQELPGGPGKSK